MSDSPAAGVATLLLAASGRCRLYGREHRLTRETIEALLAALEAVLNEERQLRLAVVGEELVSEDGRLDARKGSVKALVERLTEKGIGLLELHRGIRLEELAVFCEQLADPRPSAISSQAHLLVGAAEVKGSGRWRADPDAVSDEALQMRQLEAFARERREVRMRDAREIVLGILSHLGQEENVFFNLADVHRHDRETYQHSCNVATLAMSFALALGLRGEECFELGAAGLLHDIGKTLVPRDVLGKPGALDPTEWGIMRRHPASGARMLLRQRDIPRTAVVVAFEHHVHWAGDRGYPTVAFAPALQSQLVSVVDTFDALAARRSYREPASIERALAILREERGRAFAPKLVDAFEVFMREQAAAAGTPVPAVAPDPV